MATKNLFPLTGAEELPAWVVRFKQRPDLTFAFNDADDPFVGAAPWPVMKSSQLPLAWREADPGFPILLRDSNAELVRTRPWIYLPELTQAQQGPRYRFVNRPRPVRRTLVILRAQALGELEELFRRYPGREFRYLVMDRPSAWVPTDSREFKRELYFYQTNWLPDSVLSLNFDQHDTFTPWHVYSFHLGAHHEAPACDGGAVFQRRTIWYGEWQLVR